jgi:hypothetical protein
VVDEDREMNCLEVCFLLPVWSNRPSLFPPELSLHGTPRPIISPLPIIISLSNHKPWSSKKVTMEIQHHIVSQ